MSFSCVFSMRSFYGTRKYFYYGNYFKLLHKFIKNTHTLQCIFINADHTASWSGAGYLYIHLTVRFV